MKILLLHSGGQTAFDSEAVLAFGSLGILLASDLLAGIPNRETSLGHLWKAANRSEEDIAEALRQAEAEAEAEGQPDGGVKPL